MEIKTQDCYLPVDVKERLPEDTEEKFISTTLVEHCIGYYENSKWEGDLRGDEDYPELVTHWLEKHTDMVVLTKESFIEWLQGAHNHGYEIGTSSLSLWDMEKSWEEFLKQNHSSLKQ